MSYSSQDNSEPKSYVGTWIATLLLIVAYVLGLLIFPPLFDAPKQDVSNMVLFVGRFHPILLHLPVGALGLLIIMELACLSRSGEEKFGPAALLTLWVGAAGSVAAVLAGIMLSREGGYEGGNFTLHQTMGLIGTAGVLLALVVRVMAMGQRSLEMLHAYRAVFFLSFGIMGLGAHFGGNMSHGNKFLTEFAPEPVKQQMTGFEKWMLSFAEKPKPEVPETDHALANTIKTPPAAPIKVDTTKPAATTTVLAPAPIATPATTGNKLVFKDVILPIFEAKCNKCHSEEKSKGELRLDTFEMAIKGGENSEGTNIVAGKPDDSVTVQRIALPDSDDEHMPPDGKPQLTTLEIAVLRWWIQNGASNTMTVTEAKFPPDIQAFVDGALKSVVQK